MVAHLCAQVINNLSTACSKAFPPLCTGFFSAFSKLVSQIFPKGPHRPGDGDCSASSTANPQGCQQSGPDDACGCPADRTFAGSSPQLRGEVFLGALFRIRGTAKFRANPHSANRDSIKLRAMARHDDSASIRSDNCRSCKWSPGSSSGVILISR